MCGTVVITEPSMPSTIISCAVTGSAPTPDKNPAVPVTPLEIANSAIDAARAGAAIVHCHVRSLETKKPSMELEFCLLYTSPSPRDRG